MLRDLATVVLTKVADKRATFTRANLLAQTLRELHAVRFASPADRVAVAERTASYAAQRAVMLTPPDLGIVPGALERADGPSKFRARNSELYATRELIDAEARLLEAAAAMDGPAAPTPAEPDPGAGPRQRSNGSLRRPGRGRFSARQLGISRRPDRRPRRTGKSSPWPVSTPPGKPPTDRARAIGLAPSAAAAEVLADAVGVPCKCWHAADEE